MIAEEIKERMISLAGKIVEGSPLDETDDILLEECKKNEELHEHLCLYVSMTDLEGFCKSIVKQHAEEKPAEKLSEKVAAKVAEKTVYKVEEKAAEKVAEKTVLKEQTIKLK